MQDIVFRGLTAPLRLKEAEALLPALRDIVPCWPFDCAAAAPGGTPFYSISAKPGEPLWWCECHLDDRPQRGFDTVNAICDAVSALALALPAERPDLICLHAAGVAMAGRLVVFPNVRKAGKSTLSAALAMAGFPVFSDDVVPVCFTHDSRAHGLAMGIAPRLRLPLPKGVASAFGDWIGQVAGPANRQYQYLRVETPPHGATLPIGAYVILDRQDDPGPARLDPVLPDVAMDALLYQNFTRDRHSADILQVMAATLSDRPVYRLTYSDLTGAIDCLRAAFAIWPEDGPTDPTAARVTFRMAEGAGGERPGPERITGVRQRAKTHAARLGATLYLADAHGHAIHRMDPLAAAIWTLIEDPIPVPDLVDLLGEAFPGVGTDRIAADLDRLLAKLAALGLVDALDGEVAV